MRKTGTSYAISTWIIRTQAQWTGSKMESKHPPTIAFAVASPYDGSNVIEAEATPVFETPTVEDPLTLYHGDTAFNFSTVLQQRREVLNVSVYDGSFKVPERGYWCWIAVSFIINVGIQAVLLYLFLAFVIFDDEGKVKPVKSTCLDYRDSVNNICIFSAGQVSYGLLSLGQVNIGLVCIGQVNIGLLFSFGQIAASMIFAPIGQVATGLYVYMAQLAFGLYKVNSAQLGFQFGKCFFPDEEESQSAIVSCHS